ncbi:hypothetical protein [Bradyrhizobium sp. RT6a]|uniref:hypothetical protein n=1 Tax=Bradyrhizobium sp. RT6a TaxID=3156381 RepID=UPI003392AD20
MSQNGSDSRSARVRCSMASASARSRSADDVIGEIYLSTGALIQERRTDIVYGWNDTTQGMRLVFEFKRMGRQKNYLLEQGLGRFVTGIYSRRQAVAAMAGVLLDPDVVPPIREALEDAALATALRLKPTSGGDPIARPSNMFTAQISTLSTNEIRRWLPRTAPFEFHTFFSPSVSEKHPKTEDNLTRSHRAPPRRAQKRQRNVSALLKTLDASGMSDANKHL